MNGTWTQGTDRRATLLLAVTLLVGSGRAVAQGLLMPDPDERAPIELRDTTRVAPADGGSESEEIWIASDAAEPDTREAGMPGAPLRVPDVFRTPDAAWAIDAVAVPSRANESNRIEPWGPETIVSDEGSEPLRSLARPADTWPDSTPLLLPDGGPSRALFAHGSAGPLGEPTASPIVSTEPTTPAGQGDHRAMAVRRIEQSADRLFHTTSGPVKDASMVFRDAGGQSGKPRSLLRYPELSRGLAPAPGYPVTRAAEVALAAARTAGDSRPAAAPTLTLRVRFAELRRDAKARSGAGHAPPEAVRLLDSLLHVDAGNPAAVLRDTDATVLDAAVRALEAQGRARVRANTVLAAVDRNPVDFVARGAMGESTGGAAAEGRARFEAHVSLRPAATGAGRIELEVASEFRISDPRSPDESADGAARTIAAKVELRAGETLVLGGWLNHKPSSLSPSLADRLLRLPGSDGSATELVMLVTPEADEPRRTDAIRTASFAGPR